MDRAEAERALELADEAFGRFDIDGVITHTSAAIRGFTAAGVPTEAALACARLADTMSLIGQITASRAWLRRAERLVVDLEPCIEQGWVALMLVGCEVDDPDVLLARAELALDRARRFGDLDLEAKALADGGLAHVEAGRVPEGMAMLDEAMAMASLVTREDVAGKSVCSFFTACYYTVDVERFGTWSTLLRAQGLIGSRSGPAIFLSSHCDTVQALLLVELGRWGEAEALLEQSIAGLEAAGLPPWHPVIALADLRALQGRITDAEALLLGKEQTMQALLPAARVQLARGDYRLAASTAERGLRVMGPDRVRAVELLLVLIEARLALGDLAGVRAAHAEVLERMAGLDLPVLRARAAVAAARALTSEGDPAAGLVTLDAALVDLDRAANPWRAAGLLVEQACCRDQAGDPAGAREAAGEARRLLDKLDAVLDPRTAEVLDRFGSSASAATVAGSATLESHGGWWTATCEGTSVRLKDTKGLRYVAELVRNPGAERHVLDLVDRVEGVGEVDRRALGDAGPLADSGARTAYRHRIEELRAEIDDAQADGRDEAAIALQEELDFLIVQLTQAFGLGGRERVAGSAAEKARLNVTRALRAALAKLADALPQGGPALDRRVRTGLYCAYEPDASDEISWIVQR